MNGKMSSEITHWLASTFPQTHHTHCQSKDQLAERAVAQPSSFCHRWP